jgi:hypothetical protein
VLGLPTKSQVDYAGSGYSQPLLLLDIIRWDNSMCVLLC